MHRKLLRIFDHDKVEPLTSHRGDITPMAEPEEFKSHHHHHFHHLFNHRHHQTASTDSILENLHIYGYTKQGAGCGKKECQDKFCMLPNLTQNTHFFGVFDGHGANGKAVATYVNENFSHMLKKARGTLKRTKSADMETYLKMIYKHIDHKLNTSNINIKRSGTCCVTVMINKGKCHVANLGDSRAVLCRKDKSGQDIAIDLSADHKPSLEREKIRIIQSGGIIDTYYDETGGPCGPLRVWTRGKDSGVAMTRSMGDLDSRLGGIISEPEVLQIDLQPEDKFIIIGSDGIWDVMTSEEVCAFILDYCKSHSIKNVGKALVLEAARRWDSQVNPKCPYRDDITAVVAFPVFVDYEVKSASTASTLHNEQCTPYG